MSFRSLWIAATVAVCAVAQVRASDSLQAKMLEAVNAERAAAGRPPLCTNKKLQAAAQLHSDDMANNNFMSHDGSNGSNFVDRIKAQSFNDNGAAENVAAGQVDVASVMSSWMSSDGHRANILGDSKFFGMGYKFSESTTYKHYWTQDFANGDGEACDGDSASETPSVTPASAEPEPSDVNSATPKPTTDAPVTDAPVTPQPATPSPGSGSYVTQQSMAPAPAATVPITDKSIQQQLLDAVNAERAAAGLQPLCMNKKLQAAAQLNADDMANKNFVHHTGSNRARIGSQVTAQGFTGSEIVQSVAAGQVDVASVVKSWMKSRRHKKKILGKYTFFGMGHTFRESSKYKHYWTQIFGNGPNEVCD